MAAAASAPGWPAWVIGGQAATGVPEVAEDLIEDRPGLRRSRIARAAQFTGDLDQPGQPRDALRRRGRRGQAVRSAATLLATCTGCITAVSRPGRLVPRYQRAGRR